MRRLSILFFGIAAVYGCSQVSNDTAGEGEAEAKSNPYPIVISVSAMTVFSLQSNGPVTAEQKKALINKAGNQTSVPGEESGKALGKANSERSSGSINKPENLASSQPIKEFSPLPDGRNNSGAQPSAIIPPTIYVVPRGNLTLCGNILAVKDGSYLVDVPKPLNGSSDALTKSLATGNIPPCSETLRGWIPRGDVCKTENAVPKKGRGFSHPDAKVFPVATNFDSPGCRQVYSAWRIRGNTPPGKCDIHGGIDLAPNGPGGAGYVYAFAGGTISYPDPSFGVVKITHEDGSCEKYLHTKHLGKPVAKDGKVAAGQTIALVGNTAPYYVPEHLHFEHHDPQGNSIDPGPLLFAEKQGSNPRMPDLNRLFAYDGVTGVGAGLNGDCKCPRGGGVAMQPGVSDGYDID